MARVVTIEVLLAVLVSTIRRDLAMLVFALLVPTLLLSAIEVVLAILISTVEILADTLLPRVVVSRNPKVIPRRSVSSNTWEELGTYQANNKSKQNHLVKHLQ